MNIDLYQYNAQKERIIDLSDPLTTFPFYMHINTDEVDILFLISCVLLETHKTVNKTRNTEINKRFRQFLNHYEKNIFVNSRNNNKDCIFVAYRKIVQGDFKVATAALLDVSYLEDSIKE